MDWFSGRLEVKWLNGNTQSFHDLSFKKASSLIEENANRIVSAMYFPHPTCMHHDNFHQE